MHKLLVTIIILLSLNSTVIALEMQFFKVSPITLKIISMELIVRGNLCTLPLCTQIVIEPPWMKEQVLSMICQTILTETASRICLTASAASLSL